MNRDELRSLIKKQLQEGLDKSTIYKAGGTQAGTSAQQPEIAKLFADLAASLQDRPVSSKVDVLVSFLDALNLLDDYETLSQSLMSAVKRKKGEKAAATAQSILPGENL